MTNKNKVLEEELLVLKKQKSEWEEYKQKLQSKIEDDDTAEIQWNQVEDLKEQIKATEQRLEDVEQKWADQ